jgi:hypothetical protein
MSNGQLDFHRLQASSAAEQAVLIDGNASDGYRAADLYEQAAEHLSRVIELTGTAPSIFFAIYDHLRKQQVLKSQQTINLHWKKS